MFATTAKSSSVRSVRCAAARWALAAFASALLSPLSAINCAQADESLRFVAPAEQPAEEPAPNSTVSITGEQPLTPGLVEPPDSGTVIDLAVLATLAQQAAEEIEGAPVAADVSRPFRPITQVTIASAMPPGAWPGEPGSEQQGPPPLPMPQFGDARLRCGWAATDFHWSATGLCHRPLYFEEVNLERYGYTVSPLLQPAISGAHFFLTIPTLPYKMVAQPPKECVYTLGYYRPGSPRRAAGTT